MAEGAGAAAFASPSGPREGSHVGARIRPSAHCPGALRAAAHSVSPSPSTFGVSPEANPISSPISDVFFP